MTLPDNSPDATPEELAIERAAVASLAALRQLELDLGTEAPAAEQLELGQLLSPVGVNEFEADAEHFDFAVSRLALSQALAATKLPGWTGDLPREISAYANLDFEELEDRRARAHRARLTVAGHRLTITTESQGVQCSCSVPLAAEYRHRSIAFDVVTYDFEGRFGMFELKRQSSGRDLNGKTRVVSSKTDGAVALRFTRRKPGKGNCYLQDLGTDASLYLAVEEAEPDSAMPIPSFREEVAEGPVAALQKALGHAATFSNVRDDSRFSTVTVRNGRAYGGSRAFLSLYESDALTPFQFRAGARQIRTLRSILRRFSGRVDITVTDRLVRLTDGQLSCSFTQPLHDYPISIDLDSSSATPTIVLERQDILARALWMDCLEGPNLVTAIEMERSGEGVQVRLWSTGRRCWARGQVFALSGELPDGQVKQGRVYTKSLIKAMLMPEAETIRLDLGDRYGIWEARQGDVVARHYLAYPIPAPRSQTDTSGNGIRDTDMEAQADPTARWSEKYEPKTFEEVWGQSDAVERLQALVLSKERRQIILTGPTGAGKTTLANIFAKATLCLETTAGGSPCHRCSSCKLFPYHQDYHEYDCARKPSRAELEALLQEMSYDPWVSRWRVAFLDEAQSLDRAYPVLLKALEEKQRWAFILALPSLDTLKPEFRDRFRIIRLSLPTQETAKGYLETLCRSEGVQVEAEALQLITRFARGFRSLAETAEKLSAGADRRITVQRVRELLLNERAGRIPEYLLALSEADLQRQLDHSAATALEPEAKAEAIRELLLFLKLEHIGPSKAVSSSNPYRLLLEPAMAQKIVQGLRARAEALSIELPLLFDEIMEFWAFQPLKLTEASLDHQICRFHELVCYSPQGGAVFSSSLPRAMDASGGDTYRSSRAKRSKGVRRRVMRTVTKSNEDVHMSVAQARLIYEAATFLPQAYGVTFNLLLSIDQKMIGVLDDRRAAELASDLARELKARLEDWVTSTTAGSKGFLLHRITFHEQNARQGVVTRILMHIPDVWKVAVERWVREAFLPKDRRCAYMAGAVVFEGLGRDTADHRARMNRHWELVRQLWRGLATEVTADGAPLLDILRVPTTIRQPCGEFQGKRLNLSQSLSNKAQAPIEGHRHLSVWRDGAWDWLFRNWELKEHEERMKELKRRAKLVRELEEEIGALPDPLSRRGLEKRLQDYRASWDTLGNRWRREWGGWW